MFKWFNKYDECELTNIINNVNNYETKENDDIKIEVERRSTFTYHTYKDDIVISKSSIVSHTKNSIVFKDYRHYFNFESSYMGYVFSGDIYKSIENKKNYIEYKETQLKTYEYFKEDKCWKLTNTDVIGIEVVSEKTPLEIFKENYELKYKLIETEEEFNDYLSSTLDCNTWCRKKLYNKMKELGLGDGFINQFADLVGNDLDKYYAMIDLAGEVSDKDTLMYLYTYKFGKNDKDGHNMLCLNGTVTTTYSAN